MDSIKVPGMKRSPTLSQYAKILEDFLEYDLDLWSTLIL